MKYFKGKQFKKDILQQNLQTQKQAVEKTFSTACKDGVYI